MPPRLCPRSRRRASPPPESAQGPARPSRGSPGGAGVRRGRYLRPGWLLPARIRRTLSGRPSRQLRAVDTRRICPPCRGNGARQPLRLPAPLPAGGARRAEPSTAQPGADAHPLHDPAVYLHPVPIHGWQRAEAARGAGAGPEDGETPAKQHPQTATAPSDAGAGAGARRRRWSRRRERRRGRHRFVRSRRRVPAPGRPRSGQGQRPPTRRSHPVPSRPVPEPERRRIRPGSGRTSRRAACLSVGIVTGTRTRTHTRGPSRKFITEYRQRPDPWRCPSPRQRLSPGSSGGAGSGGRRAVPSRSAAPAPGPDPAATAPLPAPPPGWLRLAWLRAGWLPGGRCAGRRPVPPGLRWRP